MTYLLPNFLIGLQDGLQTSLIISILGVTLVRSRGREFVSASMVGVTVAASANLALGVVITFGAFDVPSRIQSAIAGASALLAATAVVGLLGWTRRESRVAAGHVGAGVIGATAFLAAGWRGLSTAMFVLSTVRLAKETTWPLLGACLGLAGAAGAGWVLFERLVRLRGRTAVALASAVVAGGTAAAGLGALQSALHIPGAEIITLDHSSFTAPGSLIGRLAVGILGLAAAPTAGQLIAFGVFGVLCLLAARGRGMPLPATTDFPPPLGDRHNWAPLLRLVSIGAALPIVLGACTVAVVGIRPPSSTTPIEVSAASCAPGWQVNRVGLHTFAVTNGSDSSTRVELVAADGAKVYGAIDALAPRAQEILTVDVPPGRLSWRCTSGGGMVTTSGADYLGTASSGPPALFVVPIVAQDMIEPIATYRATVAAGLVQLASATDQLNADVRGSRVNEAKAQWLTAHLDYERLGAAYGTFGDFDVEIDGRADGLPGGVGDPRFSGFLRLEYGLWHDQSIDGLIPVSAALDKAVHGLVDAFPQQTTPDSDLSIRVHEILENALQFELTGDTDEGSHSNLATVRANVDGTRSVLDALAPLFQDRDPRLLSTATQGLGALATALDTYRRPDGAWTPVQDLTTTEREQLDGRVGALLEDLSPIPDVLEVRTINDADTD